MKTFEIRDLCQMTRTDLKIGIKDANQPQLLDSNLDNNTTLRR